MSDIEFSNAYPSPPVPIIPVYFGKITIASMLPGEDVHTYTSAFTYDYFSNEVLIKTAYELNENEVGPTTSDGKIAVTRLHHEGGDGLIEGFIADFRRVKPGGLWVAAETKTEGQEDEDTRQTVLMQRDRLGYRTLLAAVFNDPDNRPHFMGEKDFKPDVIRLMQRADDLRSGKNGAAPVPVEKPLPREEQVIAELTQKGASNG